MRRAFAVFILLAVLSIGYPASLPGLAVETTENDGNEPRANFNSNQSGAGEGHVEASQTGESKITIVFAGLIYLRHKGGPKKKGPFTACVLKKIPGHTFRLVGDITLKGCPMPMKGDWDLNVFKGSSTTPREGAYPDVSDGFHRKNKDHRPDDYQWIADFDELYPDGYDVKDKGLEPRVKIRTGKFYTLCRTVLLSHKKGDVDLKEFGFMADITGVDIVLEKDEKLVIRSGSCDVIDPLLWQAGTRYIVFANLPPPESITAHRGKHLRSGDIQSSPPTHFLNYYFAIPKDYEDRYDFDLLEASKDCSLTSYPGLGDLLKTAFLSPPPYYCGVGGGGG